jgi:hypothetical protein
MEKEILIQFIDYVTNFYSNKYGVYPIATHDQIKDACALFVANANENNCKLYYDSLDREDVRTILTLID